MALEDINNMNNQVQRINNGTALIPVNESLQVNKILTVSGQMVRHPLMDVRMMLYGFIGQTESSCVFSTMEINGMSAKFKNSDNEYEFDYYSIYTKVLVDLKQNRFYELFPQLKEINYSCSGFHCGSIDYSEEDPDNKRNFYFFKNRYDANPDVFSDEVYLICKYVIDGEFKYGVFTPQEIIFEG